MLLYSVAYSLETAYELFRVVGIMRLPEANMDRGLVLLSLRDEEAFLRGAVGCPQGRGVERAGVEVALRGRGTRGGEGQRRESGEKRRVGAIRGAHIRQESHSRRRVKTCPALDPTPSPEVGCPERNSPCKVVRLAALAASGLHWTM